MFRNYSKLTKLPKDVTIKCQNQTFEAHSAILICHSEYFDRILFSELYKGLEIELPDIDGEVFQMILNLIYLNEFPQIETEQDYDSFADYLGYFGITLEKPLFFLAKCPYELILDLELSSEEYDAIFQQIATDILMSKQIPTWFIVFMFDSKIMKSHEISPLIKKLENLSEAVEELWRRGFTVNHIYGIDSNEIKNPELMELYINHALSSEVETQLAYTYPPASTLHATGQRNWFNRSINRLGKLYR